MAAWQDPRQRRETVRSILGWIILAAIVFVCVTGVHA